jgi:hypothetical protein
MQQFSSLFFDVYLQFDTFRPFSRPSSGAQWLQWQRLILPSYRGGSRAVFVVEPAGRPDHSYFNCTWCTDLQTLNCISVFSLFLQNQLSFCPYSILLTIHHFQNTNSNTRTVWLVCQPSESLDPYIISSSLYFDYCCVFFEILPTTDAIFLKVYPFLLGFCWFLILLGDLLRDFLHPRDLQS